MGRIAVYLLLILLGSQAMVTYADCIGDQSSGNSVRAVYVVPQFPPSQLYSHWAPFLERVGKTTHQCFDLIIPPNIPAFEAALLKGEPDFAFMNPYHQVMAYKAWKYIPLVADGKNQLDGMLIVREGGAIKAVNELNGKKVAFPAPHSFGAALLIQAYLAKEGIKIDPVYVKTHSNVYRSVIVGDVAAGGAVNRTYELEPREVRDRIKILYRTQKYRPHPFSANPRISRTIQEEVAQAIIAMGNDKSGRALLDGVQLQDPVRVNHVTDYQPLEKLGLDKIAKK